jgi:hypothetical protein
MAVLVHSHVFSKFLCYNKQKMNEKGMVVVSGEKFVLTVAGNDCFGYFS